MQWNNYVQHVKAVKEKMWQTDGLMEQLHERIVINPGASSSSESQDTSDSDDPRFIGKSTIIFLYVGTLSKRGHL